MSDFEYINNIYKKDQIITVSAWWRKEIRTKCRIHSIDKWFVHLRPLEGNPHMRAIALKDFIKTIEGK